MLLVAFISEPDWAKLSHCVLNPIYPAYIRQQLSEPDWTKLFRYILNPIHTSHNRATSPHDPWKLESPKASVNCSHLQSLPVHLDFREEIKLLCACSIMETLSVLVPFYTMFWSVSKFFLCLLSCKIGRIRWIEYSDTMWSLIQHG